jgi:NADH:ubiquinone oxidoreductase subunit 6 (subunit J)
MESPLVFWVLATVLVGSALAVVLTKNLFHSVLWLALALTGTAGVFLSLNAEFLAAVQLLLYAGGLITVVVFAIVVTERLVGEKLSHTNRGISAGVIMAGSMMLVISGVIIREPLIGGRAPLTGDITKQIGDLVLTHWALAFELLGVLLLTALIGAIYFARPEE